MRLTKAGLKIYYFIREKTILMRSFLQKVQKIVVCQKSKQNCYALAKSTTEVKPQEQSKKQKKNRFHL